MYYKETIEIAKKQVLDGQKRVVYVGDVVGVILLFDIKDSNCRKIGEKAVKVIDGFHVNSCTFNKYLNGQWGYQINIEKNYWDNSISDKDFYQKLNKWKDQI